MISSSILFRTFFIKADDYGTAFALDIEGEQYLITARHLFLDLQRKPCLKIFQHRTWRDLECDLVGHGRGEVDISVLKPRARLVGAEYEVAPSIAEMALGQDVYFLGFPYKNWADVGDLMNGFPCPFVKKGSLSSISFEGPQTLYVDAINNEGFSGGPLFFYPRDNKQKVCVAGVVSKFLLQEEPVIDGDGELTSMRVSYNTGFLIAYGSKHVLDIVARAAG